MLFMKVDEFVTWQTYFVIVTVASMEVDELVTGQTYCFIATVPSIEIDDFVDLPCDSDCAIYGS